MIDPLQTDPASYAPESSIYRRYVLPGMMRLRQRYLLWIAAGVVTFNILWAVTAVRIDWIDFVVVAPSEQSGVPLLLAGSELFACLVLLLFPVVAAQDRMRWAAMGFLVVAAGRILYGVVFPAFERLSDVDSAIYGAIVSLALGSAAFAIGLCPRRPPAFTWRVPVGVMLLVALIGFGLAVLGDSLPALYEGSGLRDAAQTESGALSGLTTWYRVVALLPVPFGMLALIGAIRHLPGGEPGGWMSLSLILSATGYLHAAIWPAAFSEIVTTGHLIGVAAVTVVTLGAILDADLIADERAQLALNQQARLASLHAMAQVRADFASMAAHELNGPLAAIRRASEVLALDPGPEVRDRMLAMIDRELGQMNLLIAELATSGALQRLDYDLEIAAVPVQDIVDDAVAFARTLSSAREVAAPVGLSGKVLADRRRIGQVMRNLVSNAVKYAPEDAPIAIHVTPEEGNVRFAVEDRGPGIAPEEVDRIFEKFSRGNVAVDRRIPGMGLGLFLSYGIVQAHGGELTVTSTAGQGSVFAFSLPVAGAPAPSTP
jgi:signal transduction histidine kinase